MIKETNISWLLVTALIAPALVSIVGETLKYRLNISLSKLEIRNQTRMRLLGSCEKLLEIAIAAGETKHIDPGYEFQKALHTIAVFGNEESSEYAIDLLNGKYPSDATTISELLSRTHKDIRSSFGLKVKIRSNLMQFHTEGNETPESRVDEPSEQL